MEVKQGAGLELFLRYAEGCRCYLKDKELISKKDSLAVKSGRADLETLRRVFYVALPGLESLGRKLGKDRFDPEVLRQYYAFSHNEKKFKEGNLICLAFPARVLEARRVVTAEGGLERRFTRCAFISRADAQDSVMPRKAKVSYMIELEPVRGKFLVSSDLDLKPGDLVMFHRINLVEKIPEDFARKISEFLQKLGLDKSCKFPRVAIRYLERLRDA